MRQYLDLMENIMKNGVDRKGRNGWTRALFAHQLRFNLGGGFPAMTTKKLAFKSVLSELIWFLEGSGDNNRLKKLIGRENTIWSENAEAPYWKHLARYDGDLGRIYGVQWRSWQTPDGREVDQIGQLLERIKTDPFDRRLVVTAWNPGELSKMALPPCHMLFQFFAYPDGRLSLHMVQRSCDVFLGVPFNIASYALLLSMVAQVSGMKPFECVITLNDVHIYHEHFDAVKVQLARSPLVLPRLWLNPEVSDLFSFGMKDVELVGYESHPAIRAKMLA